MADPDGELAALQPDSGEELWRRPIAEGRVSFVAVTDQMLIYTDGDGTHGVTITTGETQWSQPGDITTGSPIDGHLIVLAERPWSALIHPPVVPGRNRKSNARSEMGTLGWSLR